MSQGWQREEKKMYILIFTYLNVRAIHIDLVPDMSILLFFQAFIRFTNLNCAPAIIFSDNAKTFLGSSQWFSNIISFNEFQEKFESCR